MPNDIDITKGDARLIVFALNFLAESAADEAINDLVMEQMNYPRDVSWTWLADNLAKKIKRSAS